MELETPTLFFSQSRYIHSNCLHIHVGCPLNKGSEPRKRVWKSPRLGLPPFLKMFVIFSHFLETQKLVAAAFRRAGGFRDGLTMGKVVV